MSSLPNASGTHILDALPAQVKHPLSRRHFSHSCRDHYRGSMTYAQRPSMRSRAQRFTRVRRERNQKARWNYQRDNATIRPMDMEPRRSESAQPSPMRAMSNVTPSTHGIYVGIGNAGWSWTGPERSTLVLGPSRSGKTSSLVIPNILLAEGPVVSTSTKPDVMRSTAEHRGRKGWAYLFDPSGEIECPASVQRVGWSPLTTACEWDAAVQ
jgi:hypothetical protein